MDMGLDEIIRNTRKRRNFRGGRKGGGSLSRGGRIGPSDGGRGGLRRGGNLGGGVIDARLKIIQKTRAKMKDARERLIEIARKTDARDKITRRTAFSDLIGSGRVGKLRPLNDRTPIPRRTISNKDALVHTFSERREGMVYRTVKNRSPEVEELVETGWERGSPLPRLQVHLHNPLVETLHRPVQPLQLRTNSAQEDSWLRPAPNKQGVYRLCMDGRRSDDVKSRLEPMRATQEGYRIVVSNLQPSVTHEDIKELFEDIGSLVGSRVVRPGTAEVIYKTMDDALNAVDTYHNRQLDGQPMKCMLVKPSNVSGKGLAATKGSIVPDVHAIHKALFNK